MFLYCVGTASAVGVVLAGLSWAALTPAHNSL